MPIKLVAGREDRVIPPAYALGLPGQVGVHLFDKVGHMPQWEARDQVAKLLDELFRSS
jgi:pyruvate dehydrogenase E2 component (dihydrolipoamide acetyltransferase)